MPKYNFTSDLWNKSHPVKSARVLIWCVRPRGGVNNINTTDNGNGLRVGYLSFGTPHLHTNNAEYSIIHITYYVVVDQHYNNNVPPERSLFFFYTRFGFQFRIVPRPKYIIWNDKWSSRYIPARGKIMCWPWVLIYYVRGVTAAYNSFADDTNAYDNDVVVRPDRNEELYISWGRGSASYILAQCDDLLSSENCRHLSNIFFFFLVIQFFFF